MNGRSQDFYFAAMGDVHGRMHRMVQLLQDWSRKAHRPLAFVLQVGDFEQQRRSMSYDTVGNEYARLLVEALQPRLVLCGHMHKAYRGSIHHPSGQVSAVCCLDHVAHGRTCFAVFQVTQGELREVTERA